MKVRAAQKLRDMLLILGFIIMLLAYLYEPLLIVGAIVSCSCLIPHVLFNRCPHCGKQLGGHGGKYCQFCGGEIDQ